MTLTETRLRPLPKLELHLHLDGCARPATLRELAVERGLPPPLDAEVIAPPQCDDLRDYILRIDRALDLLQDAPALARVSREVVEDLADDGVVYAEIRFAPQLHTRLGLSMQAVLDTVAEAVAEASAATGVETRLILCALRHQPVEVGEAVAELGVANRPRGQVAALDLAGDEGRFEGAPFARAFDLARRGGLRRTVHAGEARGPTSIREALDSLGAERIGHGVRIVGDAALMDEVRRRGLALETCPTSNVQTRAVRTLADHPADALLRAGLRVTVNCDGHTATPTSLSREWARLAGQFGWNLTEFAAVTRHALDAAFIDAATRRRLEQRVADAWPQGDSLRAVSACRG